MLFSAWQATAHALQPMQAVEIDAHAPCVRSIKFVGWIEQLEADGAPAFGGFRIGLISRESRLMDDPAALVLVADAFIAAGGTDFVDQVMILRHHQFVVLAELARRDAGGNVGSSAIAKCVSVKPDAVPDSQILCAAAESEAQADHSFRLSNQNIDGDLKGWPAHRHFNDIAHGHAQRIGVFLGHDGCVVPDDLGQRIGRFLEPAVVREPPVIRVGVGIEMDIEAAGTRFDGGITDRRQFRFHGRRGASLRDAGFQKPAKFLVKIIALEKRRPGPADDLFARRHRIAGQERQQLDRRFAAVKGKNERLDNARRSVPALGVSPAFQIMGAGQMPFRDGGRLILIKAEANRNRNLRNRLGEVQIGGSVVSRIAADDQQRGDLAVINLLRQVLDRLEMSEAIGIGLVDQRHSCPDSANLLINRVGKGMDGGRGRGPDGDQAR